MWIFCLLMQVPLVSYFSMPGFSLLSSFIKCRLVHIPIPDGGIDVISSGGAPFDSHPDEAFAKVMDLNVRGVFNLVRECTPLLSKRGTVTDPSRVLITASVAGLGIGTLGKNGTYGYSASKAAAIHLGRNLAVELGPRHSKLHSEGVFANIRASLS